MTHGHGFVAGSENLNSMDAFLVSTGLVALAETGDKTQLLAILLAARYRKPWPIVAGILAATLLNHACAGLLGQWLGHLADPSWMRWVLAASFLAMAVWALVPDKMDEAGAGPGGRGVFVATLIAFFLAEMGDKTQVATVALAARYQDLVAVVAGTTLGMMLANVPAVWLGERITRRLSLPVIRRLAALVFALLGVATLLWP